MHCQTIGFLSQLPVPVPECHYFKVSGYTTHRWRCFPLSRSGFSRWNWETDGGASRGASFRHDCETDDFDEEDKFGFRRGAKQRIWWSDEEDDCDDEGFRVLEDSINLNWILKVFRAFGWMIPAVIISLLFGTEHNSIIMTLALPLSQTALSLVADALWGRRNGPLRPKTKGRKRKRPFSQSKVNAWMRKGKEADNQNGKRSGDFRSWMADNKASAKYEKPDTQNFGGWDELDNPVKVNKTRQWSAGSNVNRTKSTKEK